MSKENEQKAGFWIWNWWEMWKREEEIIMEIWEFEGKKWNNCKNEKVEI